MPIPFENARYVGCLCLYPMGITISDRTWRKCAIVNNSQAGVTGKIIRDDMRQLPNRYKLSILTLLHPVVTRSYYITTEGVIFLVI